MQMVRVLTCGDAFEARVVAARLGAEGVVWSLRGGQDGPLAIGTVDVLVDVDDLETARALLGDNLDLAPADAVPERETTARDVLLMCAVVLGVLVFAIARMAARV